MKSTIYDIARAAGVSTATVSKVINNKGRISEKTRNKIKQIMDEQRYEPSVMASAMKGKGTRTIALIIPDIDNPVYAEYLKRIEARGHELGYTIVMASTERDPEKEERHISLLRRKVDGYIIAARFNNIGLLKELTEDGVPVVLFAHERDELSVDSVTADDYLGGYRATEYLLELGHVRIGMVGEDTLSSHERIRGYRQALQDRGFQAEEGLIRVGGHTIDGAAEQAGMLLDRADRPTAIFGYNDVSAVGAMLAARTRGIRMPDELSIIGFDNTMLCEIMDPKLSSVSMPTQELGNRVMELLIRRIDGGDMPKQRIRLLPELAVRESTARPGGSV
ncbi:LacI family DNA-binding transcriptional regulator [Paenibacillus sacheonensis]|uniref:Substrate-binding domain-containing protein n=1 Tax=Paenibacillus sacheonensis TaxID=742054 RepID=A0A7X4YRU7_9BACL|nr:LacI family DNA-binding transcriptional regulator [Paenibacillus sacheonensis]MBM7566201.1 LacI family transcriptional regulator [Paenibacillus sacheonensis]NBC70409.1 substrate-binding domain-containing protein [Paenibacillus sacheonensis]